MKNDGQTRTNSSLKDEWSICWLRCLPILLIVLSQSIFTISNRNSTVYALGQRVFIFEHRITIFELNGNGLLWTSFPLLSDDKFLGLLFSIEWAYLLFNRNKNQNDSYVVPKLTHTYKFQNYQNFSRNFNTKSSLKMR